MQAEKMHNMCNFKIMIFLLTMHDPHLSTPTKPKAQRELSKHNQDAETCYGLCGQGNPWKNLLNF